MQEFEEKSDESFTGRERKKLRNSCLQRDSYRCVIFGHVDVSKRLDLAFRKPKERINATDCCHIIPSALASFGSDKTAEVVKARLLNLTSLLTYTMCRLKSSPRYGQLYIATSLL